jgi:predicted N-formylglutamate amidohydrolase
MRLVVSCEHASREVPARWRHLLDPKSPLLRSHRAYDAGALDLARALARSFAAPLVSARATRLLVDLNRPAHHRQVFSRFTRALDDHQKRQLITRFHTPYWQEVRGAIERLLADGHSVIHLSVHSFTPRLGSERRSADIGLLYDPSRSLEATLSKAWQRYLVESSGGLRVRKNYPYRGVAAGLTTSLRKGLPQRRYLGVELEVNQRLVKSADWPRTVAPVVEGSLHRAIRQIRSIR